MSATIGTPPLMGLWKIEDQALMSASEPLWERIIVTVDSGASDTVLPPSIARRIPMLRSTKVGTRDEVANGGIIENLGEKICSLRLGPGQPEMLMTFQVVEVHKPLLAVSRIVEAGNTVVFSKDDPHIQIKDGPKLPLKLVAGTYELELWIKNEPGKPEQGFSRLGPR